MSRRTIQMHEFRQALILMRQGKSNREIARLGILSRAKSKELREIASSSKWLDSPEIPADAIIYEVICLKAKTSSAIVPFKDKIDKWCNQGITAVVVHRILTEQYSFKGSYHSVQRYMKTLKFNPEKDTTVILKFNPGESAQVDFGKGPVIFDQELNKNISTWFFVMTLCWSRHQYAEIVSNQKIETWLGCHQRAFEWFGGIVNTVIIDNAACAIAKASYSDPVPTRSYSDYALDCGFIISACPPYAPEKKGIVESGVKYIKKNFLALKRFDSISDSNMQLRKWIMDVAGKRKHGTTREQPLTLFKTEKEKLQPLPRKFPEFGIWRELLANRNCHIRYKHCQYSFPYKLANKKLWVKISETNVKIYDAHVLVAIHPRLTKAGEIHTINEHLPAKAKNFLQHDKDWCLSKAKEIGEDCYAVISMLLDNKPVDMLRGCQSIIYLKDKYGINFLNFACRRALEYETPSYITIKKILANHELRESTKSPLSEVYQGDFEYCREIESINN